MLMACALQLTCWKHFERHLKLAQDGTHTDCACHVILLIWQRHRQIFCQHCLQEDWDTDDEDASHTTAPVND